MASISIECRQFGNRRGFTEADAEEFPWLRAFLCEFKHLFEHDAVNGRFLILEI